MSTGLELASRSTFAHNVSSWAFVGHEQPYLTARFVADHAPKNCFDHDCVPWWSFTKTALATAALQRVDRDSRDLDDLIDDCPLPATTTRALLGWKKV
jgi:CubicO group peptidase (beta-lactamase class C family)